jgi:gluconate 5-dehydrogenase
MSQALAEAGARVALTSRTMQRVQGAAARIARGTRIARGVRVTGLVMDVRDEQSVSAGVDRALGVLGGVDVLVNNAGIGMRTVNPDFMTEPVLQITRPPQRRNGQSGLSPAVALGCPVTPDYTRRRP